MDASEVLFLYQHDAILTVRFDVDASGGRYLNNPVHRNVVEVCGDIEPHPLHRRLEDATLHLCHTLYFTIISFGAQSVANEPLKMSMTATSMPTYLVIVSVNNVS